MTRNRRLIVRILTAVLATGVAATALGQAAPVGELIYEPFTAGVPTVGGIALLLLAASLAWFALHRIRRDGLGGNALSTIVLGTAALGLAVGGGESLKQSWAVGGVELSSPTGGTVDIFAGYQEFINTSGINQRVVEINLFECPAPEEDEEVVQGGDISECEAGVTELGTGSSCFLDVGGCVRVSGPRVTFRQGYYWVRADYPALRGDHSSVCAEFGLDATSPSISLTWDEALLEGLSSDFGYSSNGDDANSATSMWCWDGDGGPFTPFNHCETHNFGVEFFNYGIYTDDPDERPVFSCMETPP